LNRRIIPCLLLLDGGLVKTTCFRRPAYVGDPINAIRIFNDKEVDELIVLDIQASRLGQSPDYELIEQLAGECFMPLCYGGGITSADVARRLLSLGVEKISIQTAALADPSLLSELATEFGTQSVVASVDVRRNWLGRPVIYSAARRRNLPGSWIDHVEALVAAGAGEVMLNCVDRDGTMRGMDLEMIREIAAIEVPLIASGGAGSLADIAAAFQAGASAVAAGAMFVYHGPHRAVLITYPRPADLEPPQGI
jgi:imidazole glycerol-phosphate synthase subunit HisF